MNKYLVEEPESFIGEYSRWLAYEIVSATPPDAIPQLLDAIAACDADVDKRRRSSNRTFIGNLLHLGLCLFEEDLSPERLYNWLGVTLDQYDQVMLEKKHREAICQWLENHPEKIRSLYEYWISKTPAEKLQAEIYKFRERLFECEWPEGFSQWLIELCISQKEEEKAVFLFRKGICLRTFHHREDSPTLEEFFDFVDKHPLFLPALQDETFCKIADWRWENIRHSAEHKKERESGRSERVRCIIDHIDEVRTGKHVGALNLLAKAFFGLFADIDRDLEPRERIASITSAECAQAGLNGFIAALNQHPDAPTAAMVAEKSAKSRRYDFGYVILAGLDLLFQKSMKDFFAHPDEILASGLACHFAMSWDEDREWVKSLIRQRPNFAASVLDLFWRAHLTHKSQHLPRLYTLSRDTDMAEIGRRVTLPLLQDFPSCNEGDLKDLLLAALMFADRVALSELAREVLNKPGGVKGSRRVLWYGVAYLLNPKEYGQRLRVYIGGDLGKVGVLLPFLNSIWSERGASKFSDIAISTYGELISICGRVIHPEERKDSEEDDQDWNVHREYSQSIRGMIDRLASDTSNEALEVLKKLRDQPALTPWRDALANAFATQTRKRREEAFRYPSVGQIVDVLRGGPPANPADLQALILEHLRQLGEDITSGSTDGFKAFWNVDSYARPTSPRPEEDCRDRFLERLRERLRPIGLAAEPEGHYARDKRADIKVLYQNTLNLPVEIKRHYHRDLWTAPRKQLQELYLRDPSTGGRGIYLVFWFGIAKGRNLPSPPAGITRPNTPEQLEDALRGTILSEGRALIEIIVLDCSGR